MPEKNIKDHKIAVDESFKPIKTEPFKMDIGVGPRDKNVIRYATEMDGVQTNEVHRGL